MNALRLLTGALLLTTVVGAGPAASPRPAVTVRQGSSTVTPTADLQVVKLRRAPFSLVFDLPRYDEARNRFEAAQVVVATSAQRLAGIKVGLKTADSPYLAPGSGLAASPGGYSAIMPDTEGQHYLYYASKQDRRAALLSTNADGTLRLEWPISQVFFEGQKADTPLARTTFPALYFAFFVDQNHNDRIDQGELNKLAVSFQ